MKISKLFSLLLLGSLLLSGCRQDDTDEDRVTVEPLREGDYGYSMPYVDSSTSVIHSKYGSNKLDKYFMGQQGLELAKAILIRIRLMLQKVISLMRVSWNVLIPA